MNIYREFANFLQQELKQKPELANPAYPWDRITMETPRDPSHGDLACNAAMVLAKSAGMKPRDLAEMVVQIFMTHPAVKSAEIAGPGFVNLRLRDNFWQAQTATILEAQSDYGKSTLGANATVNVEYVSANPTGPLHTAHARGAVFGDVLANLLANAGYDVIREYYVNDAGAQVDILARSTFLRYCEALGEDIGEIPGGFYPGAYLQEVAAALVARDGAKWRHLPESDWLEPIRSFAIATLLEDIKKDLLDLGVRHDVFASERKLVDSGAVQTAFDVLESQGLIYTGVLEPPKGKASEDWEPRPQTLFKSTRFGDDVDRALKKSDGSWTYFANDIAYHYQKSLNAAQLINVFGADHGGYTKRLVAATRAVSLDKADLDVKIVQLVQTLDNGKPVKMSKRAGTFVTLRDVMESVGRDVVRFIMLTRSNDQTLEFDYAKVTDQSRENPVFYVHYAHARICSVFRHAIEAGYDLQGLAMAPLGLLTDTAELEIMRVLVRWPMVVESAARAHAPHQIAFYLQELAASFHGLWNKGREDAALRFMVEDKSVSIARLALLKSVQIVLQNALAIMGVTPVEELRA